MTRSWEHRHPKGRHSEDAQGERTRSFRAVEDISFSLPTFRLSAQRPHTSLPEGAEGPRALGRLLSRALLGHSVTSPVLKAAPHQVFSAVSDVELRRVRRREHLSVESEGA